MSRGGNYWTLFTPGIWKLLHAVLHTLLFAISFDPLTQHIGIELIRQRHAGN